MFLRHKPSTLSFEGFLRLYGGIYEHSPWIAERAWQAGDIDTVEQLHAAMKAAVENGTHTQQLALIRAHPQLAAAQAAPLTESSQSEQSSAGLKSCSPEEFAEFKRLNTDYMENFGFPFIIAVKGHTRQSILAAFRKRLHNPPETEFATALEQIHTIARFRLEALAEEVHP